MDKVLLFVADGGNGGLDRGKHSQPRSVKRAATLVYFLPRTSSIGTKCRILVADELKKFDVRFEIVSESRWGKT